MIMPTIGFFIILLVNVRARDMSLSDNLKRLFYKPGFLLQFLHVFAEHGDVAHFTEGLCHSFSV